MLRAARAIVEPARRCRSRSASTVATCSLPRSARPAARRTRRWATPPTPQHGSVGRRRRDRSTCIRACSSTLATRYESATVGPFLFKGKAQPQLLYEVGDEIGRRDDRVDDTPFVGRSEVVAQLREACARAVTGAGGSVVVTGAVGIGKSRVVREALATSPGVSVSRSRAEPYGSSSAYRMFRDPMRSMLAIERAPPPMMARALTDAVRRLFPGSLQLLALFGDVVHIDVDPSDEVRAICRRYRPERTADVVVELISAVVRGPLVIVVEDAHWADEAISSARRPPRREAVHAPWTVIVTPARRARWWGPRKVRPASSWAPSTTRRSGHWRSPPPRQRRCVRTRSIESCERAGGNPLFVGELVRVIGEFGFLRLGADVTARGDGGASRCIGPTGQAGPVVRIRARSQLPPFRAGPGTGSRAHPHRRGDAGTPRPVPRAGRCRSVAVSQRAAP